MIKFFIYAFKRNGAKRGHAITIKTKPFVRTYRHKTTMVDVSGAYVDVTVILSRRGKLRAVEIERTRI